MTRLSLSLFPVAAVSQYNSWTCFWSNFSFFFFEQKFGSLRSDVIEQMRFKQRLKVIQSLEDTAKRSVVGDVSVLRATMLTCRHSVYRFVCVCVCRWERWWRSPPSVSRSWRSCTVSLRSEQTLLLKCVEKRPQTEELVKSVSFIQRQEAETGCRWAAICLDWLGWERERARENMQYSNAGST